VIGVAAVAAALGVLLTLPGCGRESASRSAAKVGSPDQRAPGGDADPGRLPEDPTAGHQSEIQWRAHMDAEERERQLGYDKRRLSEHRTVIKLLGAARARYDRAKTAGAVARARSETAASIEDVRRRITAIDHWGVNSPLLTDYYELIGQLDSAYPEARVAALSGDAGALTQLRSDMDRRILKMKKWLEEAQQSEEE
jgi:hypothetical protein